MQAADHIADVVATLAGSCGRDALVHAENLGYYQKVACYGHDTVSTNRPMAGGPGKHQEAKNRHQLVGPHESGNAENEVQLHNQVKD